MKTSDHNMAKKSQTLLYIVPYWIPCAYPAKDGQAELACMTT